MSAEIPEAAVTAAAGRLWHRLEGVGRDQCMSIAEEALAAAAPHILREAAKPQFEQAIRELAGIEFRKRLPETLAVVNDSVEAALYPRVAEIVEAAKAAERERIARHLDALAANYPEDVFPPGADSRDGISGTAMRHAYRNAARSVREDLSDEEPGDV
jgi:hypothetical protein